MQKAFLLFTVVLILGTQALGAQTQGNDTRILAQGKSFFQQGRYTDALTSFRELLAAPSNAQAEAHFWNVKTLMALQRIDQASVALETYIQRFPRDTNREEALYLRGRILYLMADLTGAVEAFTSFAQTYPASTFVSNAYFWIGDSLLSLGKLEEAQRFFTIILEEYPNSFKSEAAEYKKSIIELKFREEDLLALLTWSHEENIKNIEEFQRREVVYQEAIRTYQTRLLRLAPDDFKAELVSLQEMQRRNEEALSEALARNLALNNEVKTSQTNLATAREQIAQLQQELAQAQSGRNTDLEALEQRRRILDAKEEALRVKEQALQTLEQGARGTTQ